LNFLAIKKSDTAKSKCEKAAMTQQKLQVGRAVGTVHVNDDRLLTGTAARRVS